MERHNFRHLRIWLKGLDIADLVYDFVETLPRIEKYNLISQCMKCACSVPANIAEGSAKKSDKDFSRFLDVALGSAYELETHLLICQRRQIGKQDMLAELLVQLQQEEKMILKFQSKLDGE